MAAVRGSLCKDTAPGAAEGDTHHLCQLSQQIRLQAPPGTKGLQRSTEPLPWWSRGKSSLPGALGTTQTQDHPADQQVQSGWHRHGLCSTTPQLALGAHRRMEVVGTCPAAGQGQGYHPPCSPQTGLRKPAIQRWCAPSQCHWHKGDLVMCDSTWVHTSPSIHQEANHPAKGLLWRTEARAVSASPVNKILTPSQHTKTISDSRGHL